MQSTTTTTTSVRPVVQQKDWGTKEKAPTFLAESKNDRTTTTTSTSSPTGGFYDQKTLWEQELHRYHPSIWALVRVISLVAYPYLMCALGSYIWPQVAALAESQGLQLSQISPPVIGAMTMMAFVGHNLVYAFLYHFDSPALNQYRVDDKPWHWDMDPQGWKDFKRNTICLIAFNFLGLTFPLMFLNQRYLGGFPFRHDVSSLPTGGELFWQLMVCTVIEDFAFHHAHQLLHTKQFYWIHKIHHQYHAPIAISAVYAHPIEYLLGNIMPSLVGPLLLGNKMHFWAFGAWGIFRVSASLENHSGYEFPWSMYQAIPFKAPTEYHDFHHNRNQETFSGVLRFWDWVYGTNHHYFEWVRAGRPDTHKTQKFKEQKQQ